jgi:hypothetical protein
MEHRYRAISNLSPNGLQPQLDRTHPYCETREFRDREEARQFLTFAGGELWDQLSDSIIERLYPA